MVFNFKKVISFVSALALVVPFVAGISTSSSSDITVDASTLSAEDITKDMGLGWNLGNSLESNGITTNSYYANSYTITDFEQYWGNPIVTKSLIDTVKAKGFNTIRIPTTWYEHISYSNGTYTIDIAWLNRVKQVVDYAYNNDMYVILNVHHEDWINTSNLANCYNSISIELKQVWKQIATYFANYDQHLIFEGMNEPRAEGTSYEWVGNTACYDVVNKLNQDFIDTVRSVSSPYKDTRLLMIPDYAASCYSSVYSYLEVPDDDYVAVSLHAYSPYDFAMGDGNHSTFSSDYKVALDGLFEDIRTYFTDKDIPVVIGEFSTSNYNNLSARKDWAKYYMTWAKELGIPCVLWDNNCVTNTSTPSEAHGYLDRSSLTWYSASEGVVDSLLSVLNDNSIVWDSESKLPEYVHSSIDSVSSSYVIQSSSNGVNISGYCSDSYSINSKQLSSSREIAVKYSGTGTPKLALTNSSWGNWTEVSAYSVDMTNSIAYFSYDDIKSAWDSSTSSISYVYVIGSGLTFYKVVSLPKATISTPVTTTTTTQPVTTQATTTTTTTSVNTSDSSIYSNSNGLYISGYCTDSFAIAQSQLSSSYDIAMRYSGSSTPRIAVVNSSWSNWTEVSPYKTSNGVAYFSYNDIKSAWGSSTSTIGYVYAIGSGLTVYSIYATPVADTSVTTTEITTSVATTPVTTTTTTTTAPVTTTAISNGKTYVSVSMNGSSIDLSKYASKDIVALTFDLTSKSTGSGSAQLKTSSGGWIGSADYSFTDTSSVTIDLSKYSNIGIIDLYMWWNSAGATIKNVQVVIED